MVHPPAATATSCLNAPIFRLRLLALLRLLLLAVAHGHDGQVFQQNAEAPLDELRAHGKAAPLLRRLPLSAAGDRQGECFLMFYGMWRGVMCAFVSEAVMVAFVCFYFTCAGARARVWICDCPAHSYTCIFSHLVRHLAYDLLY